jgi:DNA-binding beta-propeller fold protein YncE
MSAKCQKRTFDTRRQQWGSRLRRWQCRYGERDRPQPKSPARHIDHVVVGDAPEGLAISPKGDLALAILVAGNSNKKAFFSRNGGTAVVLKIDGKKVTKVTEITVGGLAEGVAFSPDGAYAYIGNFLDSDMSILKINGTDVTDTGRKLKLPGHPASLRAAPK